MSEEQHAGVVGGLLVEAGREGGAGMAREQVAAWLHGRRRRGERLPAGSTRQCFELFPFVFFFH